MRFAFKNRTKIINVKGQPYFNTLIESLKQYTKSGQSVNLVHEGEYDLIHIPSGNVTYVFIAVAKLHDVYTIRFLREEATVNNFSSVPH